MNKYIAAAFRTLLLMILVWIGLLVLAVSAAKLGGL